jgi:protein-disulfide isomerase
MEKSMNRSLLIFVITILTCASGALAQAGAAAGKISAPSVPPPSVNAQPAPKLDRQPEEDCGCEAKAPPDVLAVVNGVRITNKEIDELIKESVNSLQRQVIEARQRELYLQINSRLLEAEANKRGISSTRMLEEEVIAKVKEPTEAEARAFYDQNKSRISEEFKDAKPAIVNHLLTQRRSDEAKKLADRLRAAADVKLLVENVTPPANEAERARILATINGAKITSGDIEDSLRPLIFETQERIYRLRRKELDLKINQTLLEQEGQKRKITSQALLEDEVTTKLKPVTEAEALAFYEGNKDRIAGDFPKLKDQIMQYLQQLAEQNAQTAFAERLRNAASIETYLTTPESPVYEIATDDQPAQGSAEAPVTIIEFTDYQCSSCARLQPVMDRLLAEYQGKARLVVRDFPLQRHPYALKAAEAAEAAREQGKYWEYTTILFQNQGALGPDQLKEYARQLRLDVEKFDAALNSGMFADKVRSDVQDGARIGIQGAPTVFVNGRRVSETTYESLKAAIEAALKAPARK